MAIYDNGTYLCTLASGSSGNCIYINCHGTELLIDAGISLRAMERGLAGIGTSPERLAAVLVTHEHIDHVRGLFTLTRKYGIPYYIDKGCARQLPCDVCGEEAPRFAEDGCEFRLGEGSDVRVTPFATPHDSVASFGYVVQCGDAGIGAATDVGCITPGVANALRGCGTVVLESNYDRDMLLSGHYPPYLKSRIMSDTGHLSNDDAAVFLCRLASAGTRQAVLFHLSHENNHPILALETAQYTLGRQGIRSRIMGVDASMPGCTEPEEAELTLYVAPRSGLGEVINSEFGVRSSETEVPCSE